MELQKRDYKEGTTLKIILTKTTKYDQIGQMQVYNKLDCLIYYCYWQRSPTSAIKPFKDLLKEKKLKGYTHSFSNSSSKNHYNTLVLEKGGLASEKRVGHYSQNTFLVGSLPVFYKFTKDYHLQNSRNIMNMLANSLKSKFVVTYEISLQHI